MWWWHTPNPSTQEEEAGGSQDQPGLQSQVHGCYTEKPCLENKTKIKNESYKDRLLGSIDGI